MKTLLNKLRQVSKVRRVLFYISMVIVLVLATGTTTALAAVPGDPFLLGESNTIGGSTTRLQGGNAGAMLEIFNRSPDPNASALHLLVSPGQPPLEVSATAGKATNLDADKLDGRDSKSFADGTDGKANDADKLDGRDSTTFAEAIGTDGKAKNADLLDGRDSITFADGTNGKANDADKLDGRDSTTFADGTNGKANDADKLDGKDSSQFWSGGLYTVTESGSGLALGANLYRIIAACKPGDALLQVGGGALDSPEDKLVRIDWSFPSPADPATVGFVYVNKVHSANLIQAKVRCLDFF